MTATVAQANEEAVDLKQYGLQPYVPEDIPAWMARPLAPELPSAPQRLRLVGLDFDRTLAAMHMYFSLTSKAGQNNIDGAVQLLLDVEGWGGEEARLDRLWGGAERLAMLHRHLAALRAEGCMLITITHGEGALVEAALQEFGLREYFEHIFDKHHCAPGPKLLTMVMVMNTAFDHRLLPTEAMLIDDDSTNLNWKMVSARDRAKLKKTAPAVIQPWNWSEPECRTGLSTTTGVTDAQLAEVVELARMPTVDDDICVVSGPGVTCWVQEDSRQGYSSMAGDGVEAYSKVYVPAPKPLRPGPEDFGILGSSGEGIVDVVGPSRVNASTSKASAGDALLLGSGRFGKVYLGTSAEHGRVAIKVIPADAPSEEQSKTAREMAVMRAMDGEVGFPRLYWSGRQSVLGEPCDVLVMELLGGTVDQRCFGNNGTDWFCEARSLSGPTVLRIGRELLRALRKLHAAGFMHNDLKPNNVVFGAEGSGREDHVYLIDYGSATLPGELRKGAMQYGGGTPLFASIAEHEGRPTRPIDDIESLWYSMAFLAHDRELPWKWESPDRAAAIKELMAADGCAISEMEGPESMPGCEVSELCTTKHCFDQVDHWLDGELLSEANDALQDFWGQIIETRSDPDAKVDYDTMLRSLSGES